MRLFFRIKTLAVISAILFCTNNIYSQVVVERSKDKVIISGVAYFVHQVRKGETAYSISKAYGITVEDLTRENPPALYGVKEGQSLRIPVVLVKNTKPSEVFVPKKEHNEAEFVYHSLKPGETVYSLSRSFGVSENEIMDSNPGIDINKLSVGTEIAIPKRQFMTSQQKFDDQGKKYIYHKVLEGETLSSIARKYGVTLRQLRKENRDMRFPQVGDFVRISGSKITETAEPEVIKQDTVQVVEEAPPVKIERTSHTPVTNLHGKMNVAVLLPFYIPENSSRIEIDSSVIIKGKRTYKRNEVSEDWIYPSSLDFVEMYNGILLAADTLRTLGLNITLHTFDITSDTDEVEKLISSGKLEDMDLIIGPVYSNNLVVVSEYAKNHGIPVVSPVPLVNNQALIKNPTLFMAGASLEVSQRALAKKIAEYYDHNIVFIHADTLGIDDDVKRFKSLIFNELNYKLPYDDIKFKEFKFYSRSMFNNDSINRLSHALTEQSKNLIVIASEDPPLISEVIDNVSGLSRRFDIKLFGYPVIRELDRIEQKLLFDLDILVYSPYWIDYSSPNVKRFNRNFMEKFHTQPLEKSYAWQGFDIAYYFMSGLAMHGRSFIEHPENHYPELLESDYDFKRKNSNDGFENQKLFMVRYTKNYQVILENEGK
jgi:LysM repeat protein